MKDDVLVLSQEDVESLKSASVTWSLSLVDDQDMVEAGDGDHDLRRTRLPDGRFMYDADPEVAPPEVADDSDGRAVLKLLHKVDGSLWFKTRDAFLEFVVEVEGVEESDGMLLMETEPLFQQGELGKGFFEIQVRAN